jgi:hypothetical protein
VTAPLIGSRTAEQLEEILAVEDTDLPREIVDALDDVSGGPNRLRAPAVEVTEEISEPVRVRPPRAPRPPR